MREMFITNMKKMRKAQKLTQATFAEILDVNPKAVGAWEEYRSFPSIELLIIISDLFKKDLRDMLTKKLY